MSNITITGPDGYPAELAQIGWVVPDSVTEIMGITPEGWKAVAQMQQVR